MTILQAAVSIGALTVLLIMALLSLRRALKAGHPTEGEYERNRDGSFRHVCSVCGDDTMVAPEVLQPLSSAEKALAVRENPEALGKNLMEYVCRSCDASHCFGMTRSRVVVMGANLYEGQRFGTRCAECQKGLLTPHWSPGRYDGRIDSAPGSIGGMGLSCPFCSSVSCVDCCEFVTRKRTDDGTLLCPRCFRGPQNVFFHTQAGST